MKLIAAVDENWALGYQGDQLAYLKEDLKRFKALTLGHPVILGRRTLATFPGGKPLKGRENLILSATPGFAPEGAEVFPNLESLLARAPADSFVIGGASVYAALLPYCDTAYITKLRAAFPADVWLPNLDDSPEWEISEQSAPLEQDGLVYHYVTYERARGGRPGDS